MASTNKLNPIPHPPKKPVVGNMLSLDSTAPVQHLVRLTRELGPIFWLDMMGAPLGDDLVDHLVHEGDVFSQSLAPLLHPQIFQRQAAGHHDGLERTHQRFHERM